MHLLPVKTISGVCVQVTTTQVGNGWLMLEISPKKFGSKSWLATLASEKRQLGRVIAAGSTLTV